MEEAYDLIAFATDADEVLSIIESTMASEYDVIKEEGTIVGEVKTISVSPTGAPPKFDSTSWLADNGIGFEGDSKLDYQV